MHRFQISTYNPTYRQNFIDLNTEWLEKYFAVEPHDLQTFKKLEVEILQNDGEIFFCKDGEQVVGTVAMQKLEDGIYELAKMAVTEIYQGKGISNQLMEECIAFAKAKKAKKIILLSNRSLLPALSLYKKYGFIEVPLAETDYSRANIQMELTL